MVINRFEGNADDGAIITTNGSSFTTTTYSPAIVGTINFGAQVPATMGFDEMQNQYPLNGIIATIKDGNGAFDQSILYRLEGTVWREKFDPGAFNDYFLAAQEDRHWRFQDTDNQDYESTGFTTWNNPQRNPTVMKQVGFNISVAFDVDSGTETTIWYWNPDKPVGDNDQWDPDLSETISDSGWATNNGPHEVFTLNNGTCYALLDVSVHGAGGGTDEVWKRDDNCPIPITPWGPDGGMNRPPMPIPCSIDAAGTFIYIAALNSSSVPILLKLNTDLSAFPTIIFEPGQGSDIGVICGKEDASTIWIGGDFGDTDVLEKSENAGTTFTVKDDGTFGTVNIFHVGPDSDDRVLLVDDNVNIEETVDGGTNWTTINAAVGFTINAIARLATDVKEAVFGNASSVTNNIDYSLDSGENMEDFTTGVFPTDDVNNVIVN